MTFADELPRVGGDRSDDASVRRGLRLARRDAENDAEDTPAARRRDRHRMPFFEKRLARRRDSVAAAATTDFARSSHAPPL